MAEYERSRTRLEQLLRQRHLTLEQFRKQYERAAGTLLSERQAYRWVAGQVRSLPHPQAQAVLAKMFDEPVTRLFGPPYGVGALRAARLHNGVVPGRGSARTDWEGQVIAVSADKARDFLTRIEATNVGPETIDQFFDDLRRLVVAYLQQPLPTLLGELVGLQDRAFELLEGRQRPDQTRDLYLVAGITCGLMASVSRDAGATHDAMTQARTGYACADNAGHDGLRTWIRALQSNIAYWAGNWANSLHYAQLGTEAATRTRGTAGIFLASSEARALGALNRRDEAQTAVARAHDGWEQTKPDELDTLGGLFVYMRPGQLYYAADALSWGGQPAAGQVEQFALDALAAYPEAVPGGSFRNESIARALVALARVTRREVDGAAEALAPVLALPAAQRDHTILTAVERVRTALSTTTDPGRDAFNLAGAIEAFTAERMALPR